MNKTLLYSNIAASILCCWLTLYTNKINAQGIWTQLATPINGSAPCMGQMQLLSDGTVLALQSPNAGTNGNVWYKLTPDAYGNYINGTWSATPSMSYPRLFFSSQNLKDGRLYVGGGEYPDSPSPQRKSIDIYNPATNTWTQTPPPPFDISDCNTEILSNGKVLQVDVNYSTTVYDPASNSFSPVFYSNYRQNEVSWTKLPDGSILSVGINTTNSERYIPALNSWVTDATVPVNLWDAAGEMGGSYLLPNGKVIFIGSHQNSGTANAHTAIYTPSGNTSSGTWVSGPDLPSIQTSSGAIAGTGQQDGAGVMMVNGKLLLQVSSTINSNPNNEFAGPSYFYEYNYAANSFSQVNAPGPAGTTSVPNGAYQGYFLCLPNGQVLWGSLQQSGVLWVYTPSGAAIPDGKPAINSVGQNASGSYTLKGTKLGGINEGANYGDDAQAFTNFPIVRLTAANGTNIYYARTFNWSTRDVMTGTRVDSVNFVLPKGLPPGPYDLAVTVNGFASNAVKFIVGGIFYRDCSYSGDAVSLPAGTYTKAGLIASGIIDNDISSIKVNPGYKVTLYDGDNLTGSSVVFTADASCMAGAPYNFNDMCTSLKIELVCSNNNEPNESTGAATTLAFNTVVNGGITSGSDQDWYKITLATASNLTVAMQPASNQDVDLDLYQSNGTTIIGSSLNSAGIADSVKITNLAAGTYYIKLYDGGTLTQDCYTLTASATPVNTQLIADGTYTIQNQGNLNFYFTDSNYSYNNGAKVQGYNAVSGDVQKYIVTHLGNNLYKILSKLSSKAVEAGGTATGNGTKIQQWDYVGTNDQQWTISAVGNGSYYINGLHSGRNINFPANSAAGTVLELRDAANSVWQQWKFVAAAGRGIAPNDIVMTGIHADALTAYPNPTSSELNLLFSAIKDGEQVIITITNIDGQEMLQQKMISITGINTHRLKIGHLPDATYLLKVQVGNNAPESLKIMVKH